MFSVPELNLGSIDAINYTGRKEKEFLSRVFFRDSFLDAILEDKKYFLIGEKGTGKTAYSVLLNNSEYRNTTSTVRALTGTDYTKFIYLKEAGHLKVSHYADAWKVILLLLTAHHLVEKEGAKDHLSFYYSGADFNELTGFFQFLHGANSFNWSQFKNSYSEYKKNITSHITLTDLKEGPERFLQLLYSLNVIGFDERVEESNRSFVHWCFRDRTPVALNPKIPAGLEYDSGNPAYSVHPGLARALRLEGKGGTAGAASRQPRQRRR